MKMCEGDRKQPYFTILYFCVLQNDLKSYKQIEIKVQMAHNIYNLFQNYTPLLYCHPSLLYSPPQPIQHPIYYLNFNYFLGEQMVANNGDYEHSSFTPNSLQLKVGLASQGTHNKSQSALNSPTQNGSDQQFVCQAIQIQKDCVRENNALIIQKQPIDINSKRGNDRFIKKNTESNVINQIFSFLWTPEKSHPFLLKMLEEEGKVQTFYKLMKLIKLNCKAQLNRHYLKTLIESKEFEGVFARLRKKVKKIDCLSLQEICKSIKKLIFLYLRDISRFSIMTSKKMNPKLWKLHFRKCDEIQTFLFADAQN